MVISETANSTVGLAETAVTLARFAAPVPVVTMPRLAAATALDAAFERLADLL